MYNSRTGFYTDKWRIERSNTQTVYIISFSYKHVFRGKLAKSIIRISCFSLVSTRLFNLVEGISF